MSPLPATPLGHPTGTTPLRMLWDHLEGAATAIAATSPRSLAPDRDGRDDPGVVLDQVVARLRRVEVLLEDLAGDADTTQDARQLRSIREAVSVHLSAAASLRLLELDAKAAAVLRRAVDTARTAIARLGHMPEVLPVRDTGSSAVSMNATPL